MRILVGYDGARDAVALAKLLGQRHECPRCRQPALATASRRGHCTACGAELIVVPADFGADVTRKRQAKGEVR